LSAGCSKAEPKKKIRPVADPLPGGAGRPKFNQLEMVIYLYLQTEFGEDRCTQFRVIVVTNPQTKPQTHTQTGPITLAAASVQCNKST